MNVLLVTSEWPTPEQPQIAPFVVREVECLRKLGVQIDVYHFRGSMKPANYLKAWQGLQKRLDENKYDLLHAQFGQSGLLTFFPKRLPLVVTYQGSDLNGIVDAHGRQTAEGRLLRWVSQLVALRADQIILVSPELARSLPFRKSAKVHVIPGGLDLALFRPFSQAEARQTLGLPLDGKYVLFAGGKNNPIKRYELAENAVRRVGAEMHAQLLLANNVLPQHMPVYMNAADVLLLTSSREGSPNVVKEALACNLPVVSVDVGDVRQRLAGVTGCVVCADDRAETIAAALRQVLAAARPINGRDAVSHLDGARLAQQIIAVYEQALAS
jgi:glycosyltransferase involved in cell wall biosynthesis